MHRSTVSGLVLLATCAGLAMAQPTVEPPAEESGPAPVSTPQPVPSSGDASKPAAPEKPGLAPAEVDPEAKAKLEAAVAAISGLKSLSYRAKVAATGSDFIVRSAESVSGTVMALRVGSTWRVRATGRGKLGRGTGGEQDIDAVFRGPEVEFLDHTARKLVRKPMTSARTDIVQLAAKLRSEEIFGQPPLSREMRGRSITAGDAAEVGGVMCDVVVVSAGARGSKQRVYIGQTDHIPRKFERVIESTHASGTYAVELTDLKLDEDIREDALTVTLPEGYAAEEPPKAAVPMPPVTKPTETPATSDGTVEPPPSEGVVTPEGVTAPPIVTPVATAPSAEPTPTPEPAGPEMLPKFEVTTTDGTKITDESLHGSPALLYFWGSWSLAARKADPEVQALAVRFKERGLKVVSLAVRERDPQNAVRILKESGSTYPLVPSGDELASKLSIAAYPTFVLVNASGEIVRAWPGWKATSTLTEIGDEVGRLFGETPPARPTDGAGTNSAGTDGAGTDGAVTNLGSDASK
jgi:hypothetical protein